MIAVDGGNGGNGVISVLCVSTPCKGDGGSHDHGHEEESTGEGDQQISDDATPVRLARVRGDRVGRGRRGRKTRRLPQLLSLRQE